MATHSSTLGQKNSMDRGPAGLQSMGSQRIGHNCVTNFPFFFLSSADKTSLQNTVKAALKANYKILYLSRQNYNSLKILCSIQENLDPCAGLKILYILSAKLSSYHRFQEKEKIFFTQKQSLNLADAPLQCHLEYEQSLAYKLVLIRIQNCHFWSLESIESTGGRPQNPNEKCHTDFFNSFKQHLISLGTGNRVQLYGIPSLIYPKQC